MEAAILLVAGLGLLCIGAEAFVRGSGSIGRRLGLTPLAVGLSIVAFGTSSPELAVSVGSALRGFDGLALGNVVGSNTCNALLILGLCALIRPLTVHAQLVRFDLPALAFASLLVGLLLMRGSAGRAVGVGLLVGLAVYVWITLRRARAESEEVIAEFESEAPPQSPTLWLDLGMVAVGLALLVGGSRVFVGGAVQAAEALGVDRALIGLTIVAVGTSLPELASSAVAAWRGNADVAIGNVVGSNLFNLLGVLGATALVQPIDRGGVSGVDLAVMVASAAVLLGLVRLDRTLSRLVGGLLLSGYAGYVWLLAAGAAAS